VVAPRKGGAARRSVAGNIPAGLDPTIDYRVTPPVVLRPGEIVLLLTDGIFEASSPGRARFGLGRILDSVRACSDYAPDRILQTLRQTVRAFSPGAPGR
jgi:serine phosphatase RsbU (regulator of sigma subunit)